MTKKEFLSKVIQASKCDTSKIDLVYQCKMPDIIYQILSFAKETVFFEDCDFLRLLSIEEIEEANDELHVDFVSAKCIPLFDTGENNFIVYHYDTGKWSKLNINDLTCYKFKDTLEEIL